MIINGYAREAGVRSLENNIKRIMRKSTRKFAEGDTKKIKVTTKNLPDFLGNPRFTDESLYDKRMAGVVMGLAWTSMGGATLYIEATRGAVEGQGLQADGPAGRRHEGVGGDRLHLRQLARQGLRHRREFLQREHDPPPRARRRHAQGRPLGRHHHGHGALFPGEEQAHQAAHRHDRRAHHHRQGASHRRA